MARAIRTVCSIVLCTIVVLALPMPVVAEESVDVTAGFSVPLAISEVSVSGIGDSYATISWKTNGNATSQVFYDTRPHSDVADYAYYSHYIPYLTTEHSNLVSGLTPSTTYHYRTKSVLGAGTAISQDYTFRTLELGGAPEPVADNERFVAQIDTQRHPTALDMQGNLLMLTGNLITLTQQETGLTIGIPVSLTVGKRLGSFADAAGLVFEDNRLVLPATSATAGGRYSLRIVDETGDLGTIVILETGDATGTGREAVADVRSVRSVTGFAVRDFTSQRPSLGEVASTITIDLATMPNEAEVKMTTLLVPDPKAARAFQLAAAKAGIGDISIAYVINLEMTNLVNNTDILRATVTMTVPRGWVTESGGTGAIRIFRYDPETGFRQILDTHFLDHDENGRAVFEGISPDGLSVFALVGLSEAGGHTIWMIVLVGMAVLLATAFFFIIVIKRRSTDKRIHFWPR